MVGHLVLYEFKPELPAERKQHLHDALQAALDRAPSIRASRFGRRAAVGAGYEGQMRQAYSYFALLEFDDVDGLRAYLEHPAHHDLGALFWECSARTLVLDFELAPDRSALRGWI